ncbi:hypothetical protein BMR07_15040 [Methylococcaceae bacterium CS1]|nr:hypothetical protein BMR10_14270 [Methylococcaceae bacterium CS4]TXK94605.1 hypothetical protein BMR11_14940 [Methylococcaceae bacterium CS5]TXL03500.1 hypothetical protein BMR07_15040 [Methylococcaceae bacterium CS1]TXL06377.1 hypothetical protein BMR08_15460 [Methylococcaceae bacterium CS2]
MALKPNDTDHALQIQAGTTGRKRGHEFESELSNLINSITQPIIRIDSSESIIKGEPHLSLIQKALYHLNWSSCTNVEAIALGALATAEGGKKWLEVQGVKVKACKSDILLTLYNDSSIESIGVSVKQCNNKTPTNAQLYFTTAIAFCRLLQRNNISVSEKAINSLKQFCGDEGFRPLDHPEKMLGRSVDPRRYFWEETEKSGRLELENIFSTRQDQITKLLLQKAYLNDPFSPELLIHKTKKIEYGDQEFAIYSIDELITLSRNYSSFEKKEYSVRKGQYKDPEHIKHEAPRFGIVQMQRGGQKQHPTQLQFNLQAGYFYKI